MSSISLLVVCLESLHTDHNLMSEDALADVDRDRDCDDRLRYSTESSTGGAMGGGGWGVRIWESTLRCCFLTDS